MPRVRHCKPPLLLETEAALKEEYPMYMRLSDVSDVTGIKQNRATRDFLEGLTIYTFGRTEKWRRDDVARRIYENATEV